MNKKYGNHKQMWADRHSGIQGETIIDCRSLVVGDTEIKTSVTRPTSKFFQKKRLLSLACWVILHSILSLVDSYFKLNIFKKNYLSGAPSVS